MKKLISLIFLTNLIMFTSMIAEAKRNPEADKYLAKMLERKVPYEVDVLGNKFIISSNKAYPPGKLTRMFASYLLDNNVVKNKVVADIGAGCFALGIISAKNGAKKVIGTDVNEYAIMCARENAKLNKVENNTTIIKGEGVDFLLQDFKGKIDIIVSGLPWDSISLKEYKDIPDKQKPLSRSFYDLEDAFLSELLSKGPRLLSPRGRMFITSSKRVLDRIDELSRDFGIKYKIVKEADLHNDGNLHYILEISAK